MTRPGPAPARSRVLVLARRAVAYESGCGAACTAGCCGQTSIHIALRTPTTVPLPTGASAPLVELRCHADDPDAFVARARQHLGSTPPTVNSGP